MNTLKNARVPKLIILTLVLASTMTSCICGGMAGYGYKHRNDRRNNNYNQRRMGYNDRYQQGYDNNYGGYNNGH